MKIVDGYEYLDEVKKLILEYMKELNRDLSFQDIDKELMDLKDKYTGIQGRLDVAIEDGQVVGCVAYHRHNEQRCEMKRLFVKKEYRKNKIGYDLIKKIIEQARCDGYQEMVLDTIEPLQKAISLYHSFGFKETTAYYDNPMSDVIYMKKQL